MAVPFVAKPFSLESLRAALDPVLARARELRQAAANGRLRAGAERAVAERIQRVSGATRTGALDLVAAALELRRQRAEPPGRR